MNRTIVLVCLFVIFCCSLGATAKFYQVDGFLQNDVKWRYNDVPNLELHSKDPRIIKTSNKSVCENACTLDTQCNAYTFKGVQEECALLYTVDRVTSNTTNDFTTKSAFKRRPSLKDDSNSKLQEFQHMRLPNQSKGTIATYNNIGTLEKCYNQCISTGKTAMGKKPCIAFEYDYEKESCRLNDSVEGVLQKDENKIIYFLSS